MRNELALRYLLLRHLEPFARVVPREDYLEVARSLRVETDREGYVVTWWRGGRAQRRDLPRDHFRFYARGDRAPERRSADDDLANENDARARAFAEEVFGVSAPGVEAARGPALEPHRGWLALEPVAAGAALLAADAGVAGLVAGACVALWGLAELAPRGRLWACAPLLALAALGPPLGAALGALAYTVLQALDPDTRARGARVALCGVAAVVAALRATASGVEPTLAAAALALAAVSLAAWRFFLGAHARAVPLALPVLAAGLALEGLLPAATLALAASTAGTLAAATLHHWLPVQRAR